MARIKNVTLGKTGITVPQNGFGALPIQRDSKEDAVKILRRAYEGGMRFFDTARAYTDSEEKLGLAFGDNGIRNDIIIATKTGAKDPDTFWEHLHTSLKTLKTDHVDIYQLHMAPKCYRPDDGSGLYECLLKAKEQGKILHIGITAHLLSVADEAVESGLYETLQFPFSYLSSEKDLEIVKKCAEKGVGFIAMKSLAGGLITDSKAAMAYCLGFDNVVPIWGIQRENELTEWLSFMDNPPEMTDELRAVIAHDREELSGSFCRGCGYCLPACPMGIKINNCARMSLMIRRAPTGPWLAPAMQEQMKEIENCIQCRACEARCPYSLPIPELLQKNYDDYQNVLSGKTVV